MPTYAYACKDCSHAFEIVQSFTDSSLTSCPECQGTLRKKFNSVGVRLQGFRFLPDRLARRQGQHRFPGADARTGCIHCAGRRVRKLAPLRRLCCSAPLAGCHTALST